MATATATAAKKPAKRTARKTAVSKPQTSEVPTTIDAQMIAHADIDPNLDNVRESIVVDDELQEMAESIEALGVLEPVVVHAHPDQVGRFVLIMGHRRWTAAGLLASPPAMPCIVRPAYASRALLIAAMVTENGKRKDLSPVEEGRAFETMALDSLDDAAIAKMVSLPVRRVTDRRKLLGLAPKHQTMLHTGQLTIEHASALVEFADDARATTEIEQAVARGGPYDIKNAIANAKGRRERAALQVKTEATLKKEGVQVLGSGQVPASNKWPNPYMLYSSGSNGLPATRDAHDATGCKHLAASVSYGDDITWYCMDPTVHGLPMPGQADVVDEAENLEVQRQRESEAVARAEDLACHDTARVLRRDYLTALIRGEAALTSDMVDALMTYFVLMQIDAYVEASIADLAVWVGMGDDLIGQLADSSTCAEAEVEARDRIAKLPPARALLALAAADGEVQIEQLSRWAPRCLVDARRAWLTLVGGPLGYEWSDWEAARIDEADALQAAESDDEDDA